MGNEEERFTRDMLIVVISLYDGVKTRVKVGTELLDKFFEFEYIRDQCCLLLFAIIANESKMAKCYKVIKMSHHRNLGTSGHPHLTRTKQD